MRYFLGVSRDPHYQYRNEKYLLSKRDFLHASGGRVPKVAVQQYFVGLANAIYGMVGNPIERMRFVSSAIQILWALTARMVASTVSKN